MGYNHTQTNWAFPNIMEVVDYMLEGLLSTCDILDLAFWIFFFLNINLMVNDSMIYLNECKTAVTRCRNMHQPCLVVYSSPIPLLLEQSCWIWYIQQKKRVKNRRHKWFLYQFCSYPYILPISAMEPIRKAANLQKENQEKLL